MALRFVLSILAAFNKIKVRRGLTIKNIGFFKGKNKNVGVRELQPTSFSANPEVNLFITSFVGHGSP